MKINLIGYLLLFSCYYGFAQQEASFWYFGQNAGLQFDVSTGTVQAVTDGALSTLEGCTSISDTNGNLLFYSDGRTIWNRNHDTMTNGFGLLGDDSSTSSGVIVPKPQDPDFYYLFTVDEPHHDPNLRQGGNFGLNYSQININDSGGLGAVDATLKNVPLITYDATDPLEEEYKCSEKITAVSADDCSSIWVITHFIDRFYAFKVDVNGVDNTPVVSLVNPTVPVQGYRRNALGYLKASPDGTRLLVAHFGFATNFGGDAGGGVYLYDFDPNTGSVSGGIELYSPQNNDSPYGVEFSADSRKAYATVGSGIGGGGTSQIIQWDLDSADIGNSGQVINTSNTFSAGALQLGPDQRIYRAQVDFSNFNTTGRFIGAIENPEEAAINVVYNEQAVLLDVNGFNANLSRLGLPPFIQSLFNSETDIIRDGNSTTDLNLCIGDSYTLQTDNIPGADYIWSRDGVLLTVDGNNVPLTSSSFELVISQPGFYEVFVEPNNGDCPIEGSATVGVFDVPVSNPPSNIIVCDDNINDGFTTFDFTSKNPEALLAQDPNQYNVRYFSDLNDANSGNNELTFPFTNTANPQTIYVRVENVDNTNCFDISTFQLTVFDTPFISEINTIEFCDDEGDLTDGFATIDLQDIVPDILGSQDANETAISFHLSQDDANNNVSPLPLTAYTNTTAFSEPIFIRIENTLNTGCFRTASFNFNVNPAPEANDISLFQCDEDGIPDGFTLFNISEAIGDVSGNASEVTVEFYFSEQNAQNGTNAITDNSFSNFLSSQTLYTRVTNDNTGCISFSQVTLEVSSTSVPNASLEACDDDGNEDGFTTFDLTQVNSIILGSAPVGLDVAHYETYEDALLELNPVDSSNYVNTTAYNQTIFVRAENANACYGIGEIELTVNELPELETEFETLYCLNTFPETITVNAGILNDIPNNYDILWSTGESSYEIEINAAGTYTVTVTNASGCSKVRTVTVTSSNIATINDIQVTDVTENNSITILVSGEGDYEFALDSDLGPYQDSNTFENLEPGFYTVYVKDKNDCGIVDELVSVIGFPRFFTPNGDTENQYWKVEGISSQFQPNSEIIIFDRYGKILAQLNPLGPGWDGTYNGRKMPTNDYWFKITLQDGRLFTGHFTLKR